MCTTKPKPRHGCSVEHLATVTGYRSWRAAWEQAFDSGPALRGADSPEAIDWRALNPGPTFKAWLLGLRGES